SDLQLAHQGRRLGDGRGTPHRDDLGAHDVADRDVALAHRPIPTHGSTVAPAPLRLTLRQPFPWRNPKGVWCRRGGTKADPNRAGGSSRLVCTEAHRLPVAAKAGSLS